MKTVCFVNPRLPMFVVAKASEISTVDKPTLFTVMWCAFWHLCIIIIPNNVCIAYAVTNATNMLQVVDFSHLLQVSLLHQVEQVCENHACCNLIFADLLQLASSLLIKSLNYQLAASLLTTCNRLIIIKPGQAMRMHPDVGLMTEACDRLAATYAFLAVYSNIIIINVCECCVNYIQMLMQS